jgi:hypothetical protein
MSSRWENTWINTAKENTLIKHSSIQPIRCMTHTLVVRPVLQSMWSLSVSEWKGVTTAQQALTITNEMICSGKLETYIEDEYLSILRGATGHRNGSALLGAAGERAGWELFWPWNPQKPMSLKSVGRSLGSSFPESSSSVLC